MNNIQRTICDLIDQLEALHGITPAFRVTRHLLAAHDELAKRPLGPKPAKDQIRAVATHRTHPAVRAETGLGRTAGTGVASDYPQAPVMP